MDGYRFDELARALGRVRSRRQMLKAVAGAMVAAAIGGAARPATAGPPPLPPFPNVCSSPKSPPAPVTITPLSANVVTGDCTAFNAFATKGVADTDGNRVANQVGATVPSFTVGVTLPSFTSTPNKKGQFCATVTVSYPATIHISMTQSVTMLQWQPTPPPTGACLDAWNNWQQQVKAHEGRHVADNLAVLHALQQRWKTPRTYSACANTDNDLTIELPEMIGKDLDADVEAAQNQMDICSNAFHKTPAGGPSAGLDCSKCCKENKSSCSGKCCENGLVCSTDITATAGIDALVLASNAECVCPNGQLPAPDGSCQATAGSCPVGTWHVAQLRGAPSGVPINIGNGVSWKGSLTLSIHADQTYAFAYNGFEIDVNEPQASGPGTGTFAGGSNGTYTIKGNILTVSVQNTSESLTISVTVSGQTITVGPNSPSALVGTESFFMPSGAYTFACNGGGQTLTLQGPTGASYVFQAVSNQHAMARDQRGDVDR